MTTQPPIACTLTPAEMQQRAAEITALGGRVVEHALTVRFPPGARHGVEAFVAAESRCCPFLRFEVEAELLTIAAPPGAEQILAGLASRFAPR